MCLNNTDFIKGNLQEESMIRPNRIFTADKHIISYKIGSLKENKIKDVEDSLVVILTS